MDFPEIETEQGKARFALFDGSTALAHFLETECRDHFDRADRKGGGKKWNGGNMADTIQWARLGDNALVPRSDKLMDRLEAMERPERSMFVTQNMVAGGVPNVPAYLSGSPMAMRMRRRVMAPMAPVVVLSDNFAAFNVKKEQILRRGAAVLALVRALTAYRPVTLYSTIGLAADKKMVGAFRVETAPLDLARAAWALGSPTVLRNCWHLVFGHICGNGYKAGFRVDAPAAVARELGFSDYIVAPRVENFETDEDAAAWVASEVEAQFQDEAA